MGKYKEIRWTYSEFKWIANNVERWWKLRSNMGIKRPEVKNSPEFRAADELVDKYRGLTKEFNPPDYASSVMCTRPQLQLMKKIVQTMRLSCLLI